VLMPTKTIYRFIDKGAVVRCCYAANHGYLVKMILMSPRGELIQNSLYRQIELLVASPKNDILFGWPQRRCRNNNNDNSKCSIFNVFEVESFDKFSSILVSALSMAAVNDLESHLFDV